MGAWLLSAGCGNTIAGKLAGYVAMPEGGFGAAKSLEIFHSYFYVLATICMIASIIFIIFTYVFRRVAKINNLELV